MKADVAVALERLPHGEGLEAPAYQSAQAAGVDIQAAVRDPLVLEPGAWSLIPSGFKMELPPGFEAQVRPRSGLALKYGVTVLNAPGTIDADYRGEIQVLLVNHGKHPFVVRRGERIAQMVIAPVVQAAFVWREKLSDSARGQAGFGSTG